MTKSFIKKSKITKSKIFLVFQTCHSMRWFLWVNVNRAEASTNGAKFQFDSFGELVCELRQIEVFHSWWAFCLLFSHKKVGRKNQKNE